MGKSAKIFLFIYLLFSTIIVSGQEERKIDSISFKGGDRNLKYIITDIFEDEFGREDKKYYAKFKIENINRSSAPIKIIGVKTNNAINLQAFGSGRWGNFALLEKKGDFIEGGIWADNQKSPMEFTFKIVYVFKNVPTKRYYLQGNYLAKARGPKASLLLLMDASESMYGPKLVAAKTAAIEIVKRTIKSKNEIAILAFQGDCRVPISAQIDFTRDSVRLFEFINNITTKKGTPLAEAIRKANEFMASKKSPTSVAQMVLLLADGDDQCGNLPVVLNYLKRKRILYRHETIGLEVAWNSESVDHLKDISRMSGGRYRHVTKKEDLLNIFEKAVESINMLEMLGNFKPKEK